jgi:phosphomannomutase
VLEYLHDQGITTYRSAVGRVAFGEMMRLTDAPLGFELSGHVYWKSFAGVEAPEYTLLAALRMIEQSRESLTELARPIEKYVSTDEINIPMQHAEQVGEMLNRIARFGAGHNVDRLDGVTVDAWDTEGWWCNVRASHTESLVRLVAEAKEKHLLNRVVTEVLALLRS